MKEHIKSLVTAPTILLTAVTSCAYLSVYLLEFGQCFELGIPSGFIEINISSFMILTVVLFLVSLTFLPLLDLLSKKTFSVVTPIVVTIATLLFFVVLIFVPDQTGGVIRMLLSIVVMTGLLSVAYKRRITEEYISNQMNLFPGLQESVIVAKINERLDFADVKLPKKKVRAILIVSFFFFPFTFFFSGIFKVMISSDFQVLSGPETLVFVKKYADNLIFKPLDGNYLSDEVVIIKSSPTNPIRLKDTVIYIDFVHKKRPSSRTAFKLKRRLYDK